MFKVLLPQSRVAYFKFTTCILSALAWINCLVCTVFIVIGFTEWCSSVTNNGNVERCVQHQFNKGNSSHCYYIAYL